MKNIIHAFIIVVVIGIYQPLQAADSTNGTVTGSSSSITNTSGSSSALCSGKFANPITDYCWSCMFPMTIANQKVMIAQQEDNNSSEGTSAICACQNPPRVGIMSGFWEPTRLIEITRNPYCFPSLGGMKIDFGVLAPSHARPKLPGNARSSFYNVHWYTNPLLFWLEVLMDDACLEKGVFDLAYITELDPLWADSTLTFLINPDASLFGNVIAQAACAADCVQASAGFANKDLYWCSGCQGSIYPLNGWIGSHITPVQASSLLVSRMTAKLHRELLMWGASGSDGQCGYYPQPLMDKTNYKFSMVYPIPQTKKIFGKCCQPYGRTTALWGAGRTYPVKGEDFAYQIFRKRNCCTGNLVSP